MQEEVPPTIQLLSPAEGILTTNVPTFVVEAFDEENGSGIDPSSLSMLIDGVEGDISTQATEKGYQFTYTPRNELSEGNHSLTTSIQDNDGNQASLSSVYIVDTVPPELTVNEYRQIVDDESITVEGITKDVTTSPVTLLVGGEEAAIDEHGQFSHTVPLLRGGELHHSYPQRTKQVCPLLFGFMSYGSLQTVARRTLRNFLRFYPKKIRQKKN